MISTVFKEEEQGLIGGGGGGGGGGRYTVPLEACIVWWIDRLCVQL